MNRVFVYSLVAASLGLAASAAEARDRIVAPTHGPISVDIQADVQAGHGLCRSTMTQSADINIGAVVQRCDRNQAVATQTGRINHFRSIQRQRR